MLSKDRQVVNIKLSKSLQNLGVKQESLFYWVKPKGKKKGDYFVLSDKIEGFENISAFTVGEILQMLPASIFFPKKDEIYFLELYKNDTEVKSLKVFKGWKVFYFEDEEQINGRTVKFLGPKDDDMDENLANAGAKVLIYLIKKGFVKF